MLKVYPARGMTNRKKDEVVSEATAQKEFLEKAGFIVLCPVAEEKVKAENKPLRSTYEHMVKYWARDKQMIREANLVFDMTPHLNSEGVKHELGYARYSLFKPIVRVFPEGQLPPKASIAHFEDDYVCDSLLEAVEYSLRVHGTFYKRVKWRLAMLNRCLLKWIWYQIREFK